MMEETKINENLLSFIGESFAKVGFMFYFQGINPNCPERCALYATCQTNLETNTVYRVAELKDRRLDCPKKFHKEPMRLVRLEKPELLASMHNKDIYEGSIINFTPVSCDHTDCGYIDYCEPHKLLLQKDLKAKIVQVKQKINDCPRDFHLSIVELERKGQK